MANQKELVYSGSNALGASNASSRIDEEGNDNNSKQEHVLNEQEQELKELNGDGDTNDAEKKGQHMMVVNMEVDSASTVVDRVGHGSSKEKGSAAALMGQRGQDTCAPKKSSLADVIAEKRCTSNSYKLQIVHSENSGIVQGSAAALMRPPNGHGLNSARLTRIDALPGDMLMEIFDRLPAVTARFCPEMCRSWRLFYRRRQTSLTLRETPIIYFPLRARGFFSLVSLTLDFSLSDYPEPGQTVSTVGGRLVQLVTDQHLATVALEFPRLERLELLGCDVVTGEGLTHLVRQCRRLVYLRLRDCRHFDDVAVIAVVRASMSIQHLSISFCEVTAGGIVTLRTLTRVSAEGCPRSEAFGVFPHQI